MHHRNAPSKGRLHNTCTNPCCIVQINAYLSFLLEVWHSGTVVVSALHLSLTLSFPFTVSPPCYLSLSYIHCLPPCFSSLSPAPFFSLSRMLFISLPFTISSLCYLSFPHAIYLSLPITISPRAIISLPFTISPPCYLSLSHLLSLPLAISLVPSSYFPPLFHSVIHTVLHLLSYTP